MTGWLIANLVLLSGSMFMTWYILGFEPPPALKPVAGWDFIFTRIATSITLLLEKGIAWLWILSFLQGVGGIFIIGYLAYRVLSIANPKTRTGSRLFSITLLAFVVIFIFRDFAYGVTNLPLPGYWLFIVGAVSSAIFEWENSTPESVAPAE